MRAKRKVRTGLLVNLNGGRHLGHRGYFLRHIRVSRRDALGTPSSSALFDRGRRPVSQSYPSKVGEVMRERQLGMRTSRTYTRATSSRLSLNRRSDG